MIHFLSAFVVLAATVTLTAGPRSLSTRRIPATPEISISFPTATTSLIADLQSALIAADVPSGIEQAPPEPSSEQEAGAGRPATWRLNGQTVGEILDAFIAFDPRYQWSESDGRILIRPRSRLGSDALLQKRLDTLTLRRSTMREAVAALADLALTPEHRQMTIHFPSRKPSSAETQVEPVVSVSLQKPTLLESLNAISRAAGNLSWHVDYRTGAGTADVATLRFRTPDKEYAAIAPGGATFEPKHDGMR